MKMRNLRYFANSSFSGEGGIRTPGASQLNSFQDCRNRPLYHLSSMYPFGEGSAKICNNLLLCKHFPKKDFENLATGAVTTHACAAEGTMLLADDASRGQGMQGHCCRETAILQLHSCL